MAWFRFCPNIHRSFSGSVSWTASNNNCSCVNACLPRFNPLGAGVVFSVSLFSIDLVDLRDRTPPETIVFSWLLRRIRVAARVGFDIFFFVDVGCNSNDETVASGSDVCDWVVGGTCVPVAVLVESACRFTCIVVGSVLVVVKDSGGSAMDGFDSIIGWCSGVFLGVVDDVSGGGRDGT